MDGWWSQVVLVPSHIGQEKVLTRCWIAVVWRRQKEGKKEGLLPTANKNGENKYPHNHTACRRHRERESLGVFKEKVAKVRVWTCQCLNYSPNWMDAHSTNYYYHILEHVHLTSSPAHRYLRRHYNVPCLEGQTNENISDEHSTGIYTQTKHRHHSRNHATTAPPAYSIRGKVDTFTYFLFHSMPYVRTHINTHIHIPQSSQYSHFVIKFLKW